MVIYMKVLKSHFITRLRKYYGELWINMPDPGNQYFARVSILPENNNLAKDVLYLAHQIPDDIGDSKYKDVFIFSCDNMKKSQILNHRKTSRPKYCFSNGSNRRK